MYYKSAKNVHVLSSHFPSPEYVSMIKRLCRKLLYMYVYMYLFFFYCQSVCTTTTTMTDSQIVARSSVFLRLPPQTVEAQRGVPSVIAATRTPHWCGLVTATHGAMHRWERLRKESWWLLNPNTEHTIQVLAEVLSPTTKDDLAKAKKLKKQKLF